MELKPTLTDEVIKYLSELEITPDTTFASLKFTGLPTLPANPPYTPLEQALYRFLCVRDADNSPPLSRIYGVHISAAINQFIRTDGAKAWKGIF